MKKQEQGCDDSFEAYSEDAEDDGYYYTEDDENNGWDQHGVGCPLPLQDTDTL